MPPSRQFPEHLLTRWPHPAASTAEPSPSASGWTWRAPKHKPEAEPPASQMDMGTFTAALRRAEVLDHQAVNLPGGVVMMPYGVRLLERYVEIVHRLYREAGLELWEYPFIAPTENFAPVDRLLDLGGSLLHVGNDDDFAEGTPRATLCPTGEEVIYPHWGQIIRCREDLPLRMYRRSRYFRPSSSGRRAGPSLFRGFEAPDVFEFHCAYEGEGPGEASLSHWLALFERVAHASHVPVLWSTRPPWTNRAAVSRWTIGGDAPLPTGRTVQVGSLYNQGHVFAEAFGVGFKEHGVWHPTYHITGALSRRLLYAHLMLGLHPSGDLFVHPDLAPDHISVTFLPGAERDENAACALVSRLREGHLRVRFALAESSRAANKMRRKDRERGVPVQVFVQGRRTPEDAFKVVVGRADTHEEAVEYPHDLHSLAPRLGPLLRDVGTAYDLRARAHGQVQEVGTLEGLEEAYAARRVAVCPLRADEASVREIDAARGAEVLGFVQRDERNRCVLSGASVPTLALVSPRH